MKLERRSFLKALGGAAVAVAAAPYLPPTQAPLFVPAQNLDMGVPRRIVTATEMPIPFNLHQIDMELQFAERGYATFDQVMGRNVPMLMIEDNYSREYGGGLIRAGSEVMVDRTTAERWVTHRSATPGPSAPKDLQEQAAKVAAARAPTTTMVWANRFLDAEELAILVPIPVRELSSVEFDIDAPWDNRRMNAALRDMLRKS